MGKLAGKLKQRGCKGGTNAPRLDHWKFVEFCGVEVSLQTKDKWH